MAEQERWLEGMGRVRRFPCRLLLLLLLRGRRSPGGLRQGRGRRALPRVLVVCAAVARQRAIITKREA